MEQNTTKPDRRKNNPGRNGRKNTQVTPSTNTEITTTEETTSPAMEENNNNTPDNLPVDNTKNLPVDNTKITPDVSDEGINLENIENANIIDESKLSDKIEPADITHTPLNEDVVHEDYRNQFAGTFKGRVEEPVFTKPDVNAIHKNLFGPKEDPKGPDATTNQTTGKTEPKVDGANPLSDTKVGNALKNNFETPDERRQGAELLVDGVLDAYGLLHQIGAWAASVNIEKLQEEQLDGKIDLSLQIPVDPNDPNGESVPLQTFLENYNLECKKTITLDPDFVAKVRPVMIRVCEKNGWGLSDEQYLIYLFGRDITEKVALIIGMRRAVTVSLRMIKKGYAVMKAEHEKQMSGASNNSNQNNNNNGPYQNPRDNENKQTPVSNTTSNVMGDKKSDDAMIASEKKEETTPGMTLNPPDEKNIEL